MEVLSNYNNMYTTSPLSSLLLGDSAFGHHVKQQSNQSHSLPSSPNSMIPSSQSFYSTSPTSSQTTSSTSWRKCCANTKCLLCSKGTPRCLCMNHPSWTLILRVVFYSLSQLHPDKEFFNLKKEVYVYLNDHWEILSPTQKQSTNWKRQVQDALSHSRFFRSGRHTLRCNGYWQLKLPCNPWNYNNSKQFEALRYEDQQLQQHQLNQHLNQHSQQQQHQLNSSSPSHSSSSASSSPSSSPLIPPTIDIPWRMESFKRYESKAAPMDIKQLCGGGDQPQPTSPLSDSAVYSLSNSRISSSQLGSIKYSNSISSLSLLSDTAINNSSNNNSVKSTPSISSISSPSFKLNQFPSSTLYDCSSPTSTSLPTSPPQSSQFHFSPYHQTNNINNNSSSFQQRRPSPLPIPSIEFDEELIVSKIHQMKSILNCTV